VTFFNALPQTAKQSVAANPEQMDKNGCDIWTQRPPNLLQCSSPQISCIPVKSNTKKKIEGVSRPWKHCALFGCHWKQKNQAIQCFTKNEKNKSFPVMICHQQYAGQIVMITTSKRPWAMAQLMSHVYMNLTLLRFYYNPVFTLSIPVRINGIIYLTHKLIFKTCFSLEWNNSCTLCVSPC